MKIVEDNFHFVTFCRIQQKYGVSIERSARSQFYNITICPVTVYTISYFQ